MRIPIPCSAYSILTLAGNSTVHGDHRRYAVTYEDLPYTGCAPALGRVGIGDLRALVQNDISRPYVITVLAF